jgi:hypothetical protein
MRSFTVLLLLGAIPALSWVIPDETNQHVFEVFETEQGKSQSRLHSPDAFVEEPQDFDLSWAANAFRKYAISRVHDNDDLGSFFDDAWTSHFETLDLDDDYTTTGSKKDRKKQHNDKKHRDGKHRKDDPHRKHRGGCHCGEPEEPP